MTLRQHRTHVGPLVPKDGHGGHVATCWDCDWRRDVEARAAAQLPRDAQAPGGSPMKVSPAAAAGVSRVLQAAGLRKSTTAVGIELEGFTVDLHDDHVRVGWVTSAADRREAMLAFCDAALINYDVTKTIEPVAYPGEWRDEPVLRVSSGSWGR